MSFFLRYRKVYFNTPLYKYLPSKEKHKKEIINYRNRRLNSLKIKIKGGF
jgi:hypothetical protein